MDRPIIEQIHKSMVSKGMVVFDTPFSLTLGAIRTLDVKSNKFNDWLFASMFTDNGGIFSTVIEGTTDAGLYYRENPININGTAIIAHDIQHRGAYEYQNPKINPELRGHKGKEAFKQVGIMKYWRDSNKDDTLDFSGEIKMGNYATNGHDMGSIGNNVDKWSAGCWGSEEKNMDLLYTMAKIQIDHGLGSKFSFALLYEETL